MRAAAFAAFAALVLASCTARPHTQAEPRRAQKAPRRAPSVHVRPVEPRPALVVDLPPPSPPIARTRPTRQLPPVPEYLVEPPAWMSDLEKIADDVQLVDVRPSKRPPAVAARALLVPTAPRIAVGGDALSLAETALSRGDAFDAAAQLTTLLAKAPLDARPYLEVQLSRAYVALGRFDEADAVLRKRLETGGSSAWPAVFELATLHVTHRAADPSDVFEWLAPYAGPLREDLAGYLMRFTSSPEEIAQLRGITVPPPAQTIIKDCADQLTAFERKRPHGLRGWRVCPVATLPPTPIGHSRTEREQLKRIASEAEFWTALFYRPPDPERWLYRAHRMGDIVALDPNASAAVLASWLALVAYQNAANTAAHRGEPFKVTRDYLLYADGQIDRLHPQFRDDIRRIAAGLFVQ
jgi:hypothetical protein